MKDFTKEIIALLNKRAKEENCKIKQAVRDNLIKLLDETEGIKEDVVRELCDFRSARGVDHNINSVHMYLRNVRLASQFELGLGITVRPDFKPEPEL